MNAIEINNLNLTINKNRIFSSLKLNIRKGSFTNVLAPVGGGKTCLVNLIMNNHKNVKINGICHFIHSNPNDQIIGNTVIQQLIFWMKNYNYSDKKIKNRIDKITKEFGIEELLELDPFILSLGMRQLIVILSYLVLDLDILIMDNALNLLDENTKIKVLKFMKKKKKITIINFTSNSAEILFGAYTVILNKKIIANNRTSTVIKDDKKFLNNNLSLPFIAELSLKLKYYGVIDKIYVDSDKLVDAIWK